MTVKSTFPINLPDNTFKKDRLINNRVKISIRSEGQCIILSILNNKT